MMNFSRSIVILVVLLALAFLAGGAWADAMRDLVREGNRLFAEEKYDEALQKYRAAQVGSPESPYLHFNIGNALLGQGKFDEAIAENRKVYSHELPSLGTWALYNIGVGQYRQAEQAIGAQDFQEALKLLEACMESNREAMKLDPKDEDPKFNYEQARRKREEVLKAIKKQMEEQKKKQQQKDNQQEQDQQQQKQDQQQSDQQGHDQQEKQKQQAQKDRATSESEQGRDRPTSGTGQAQPQPREGEMSPEEAERLLNSLPTQKIEDLHRFLMPRGRATYRIEKDW